MGEYNEAADVYTVRQSDAHSWVEVYFPRRDQSGVWVMFDPTPAAGLSVYGSGVAAWLRHHREAMEMFLPEDGIRFCTRQQFWVARAAPRWGPSLPKRLKVGPRPGVHECAAE